MADDALRTRQHDELMPGTKQADGSAPAPLPLLFLMADTGGGHRNAARAVGESLELAYPGRFAPVLCDPLGGPGSTRLLRRVTGLYGPVVRLAPWLWGAAYLALIATGLSNDEISREIYVSPATVKTHASRAMTKLGARDRAQLVVFAYQAGLIRPA